LAAYAFNCANLLLQTQKTTIIFPPKKKKKKRKKKKRICKFKSNGAAAVKVFWKNTLFFSEALRKKGRFFQKPAGLDLYCR